MIDKIKGLKRYTTANLATTKEDFENLGRVIGYNEAIDDVVKLLLLESCEKLKDKNIPTFEDWLVKNGFEETRCNFTYKKNNTHHDIKDLLKHYQMTL